MREDLKESSQVERGSNLKAVRVLKGEERALEYK